jgi:hypothetical protein
MYHESRKHPSRQTTVSAGNLSVILLVTACTYQRRFILGRKDIHDLIVDAWTELGLASEATLQVIGNGRSRA